MSAPSPVALAVCPVADLEAILGDRRGPSLDALAGARYGIYVRSGPLAPWWSGCFILDILPARDSSAPSILEARLLRAAPNGPAGPWIVVGGQPALPPATLTLRTVDPADRDNRHPRALAARACPRGTAILDPLQAIRAYVVEAAPDDPTVLVARVLVALGPWRPFAAWAVLHRL